MPEVKNSMDGMNSNLDTAKEKISELADIATEAIQNQTEKKLGLLL